VDISNGDRVFDMLKERLDVIEKKLDAYAASHADIRADFAACRASHTKDTDNQARAIGWLYGIVAVIVLGAVVERLVGR